MIWLLLIIVAQFFVISILARALWFIWIYSTYKEYLNIYTLDINHELDFDNYYQYLETFPIKYIIFSFWHPKYWLLRTFMSYPTRFDEVIHYINNFLYKRK